jgi:hypothetical protein
MKSVIRVALAVSIFSSLFGVPVVHADSSPPTVTAPVQQLVVGHSLGGSHIPARISWGAASDPDGVYGYWLQERVDGGTWRTVALPTRTTRAVVRALYPWHTYQYQVKASDTVGNSSAWAVGPSFVAIAYDNNSSAVTYSSSWYTRSASGAWKGTVRTRCFGGGTGCTGSATGAWSKVTFFGRTVAYVAPRYPFAWFVDVYVDNVWQAQVDLYSSSNQYRRINFVANWATPGNHTLMVKYSPNPSPYKPNVDVDAFAILR